MLCKPQLPHIVARMFCGNSIFSRRDVARFDVSARTRSFRRCGKSCASAATPLYPHCFLTSRFYQFGAHSRCQVASAATTASASRLSPWTAARLSRCTASAATPDGDRHGSLYANQRIHAPMRARLTRQRGPWRPTLAGRTPLGIAVPMEGMVCMVDGQRGAGLKGCCYPWDVVHGPWLAGRRPLRPVAIPGMVCMACIAVDGSYT